MESPTMSLPGGMEALTAMGEVAKTQNTLEPVKIRTSQIDGCGFYVDMHTRDLGKKGKSDVLLFAVAA
jgi:AhpD family alkylhydroperoxidase